MNEIARKPPVGHPIGAYVPMVDGPEKVSGRARYTADFLAPQMLAGRIYRSPYAHAEIIEVDTSAAAKLPGVIAVVTGADCDKTFGVLPIARSEHPLARDKVRYKGEPVAAVAAVDEATAEAAVRLISMKVRELPAYYTASAALAPDAVPLHAKKPGNLERDVLFELGNVADGFARSGAGARSDLQLRRGVPEPDGDARRGRRLRRRARPPHGACLHPGSLLRAPDAGPDSRHGHVEDPGDQAVRRRGLRLPHGVPQRRADRGAAGAQGRRRRAHHDDARGDLHHPPRPAGDGHPPQDRAARGRAHHGGGMRMHPAGRRALGLRRGDDPLFGLDALRHLRPQERQVHRQARAHQHAAVRGVPRPRHGRRALRLREPARPDGGRDGPRSAQPAPGQFPERADLHRQRPDGEQLRAARVHRLGGEGERLEGAQGQARPSRRRQAQGAGLCLLALHLRRLQARQLDRRAACHRQAQARFRRLDRRADGGCRDRPGLLHRAGADGGGDHGPRHFPRAHRLGRQRRGAQGQRLLFLARHLHRRQCGHRRGQQAQGPADRSRGAQARGRARRHRVPGRGLPRRRAGQGLELRGGGGRGAEGRAAPSLSPAPTRPSPNRTAARSTAARPSAAPWGTATPRRWWR